MSIARLARTLTFSQGFAAAMLAVPLALAAWAPPAQAANFAHLGPVTIVSGQFFRIFVFDPRPVGSSTETCDVRITFFDKVGLVVAGPVDFFILPGESPGLTSGPSGNSVRGQIELPGGPCGRALIVAGEITDATTVLLLPPAVLSSVGSPQPAPAP